MDGLAEERKRGLTIDVAHKRFDTPKYYFTIIDAPGHRDFVKNMITGTSQADAAVIVVSCPDGPQEQTKEHVFLARTLGVPEIIVAINKMDSVNYEEAKFEEAKEKMSKLLATVGFRATDIPFIPISAFKGDNATKDKGELKWWKGPSLLEALDNLTAPDKPTDKALRLPVQDVYSITGIGTVPVGRVETGVMKPGMEVHFMPSDKSGEVKSIEMHWARRTSAAATLPAPSTTSPPWPAPSRPASWCSTTPASSPLATPRCSTPTPPRWHAPSSAWTRSWTPPRAPCWRRTPSS